MRWFPNRWPAMDGDRCEVVLYTPDHDATFWSLGLDGARQGRSTCGPSARRPLGARDRRRRTCSCSRTAAPRSARRSPTRTGRSTPTTTCRCRPGARLDAGWRPDADPGERAVVEHGGWRAWVPWAPMFPVELEPGARSSAIPDLPSCDDGGARRAGGAAVDVLERLDRLYGQPLPYMMWLNQRPTVDARLRRRLAEHRDRLAVARPRRAALHRRRRGRRPGVLQPRRPRATRRPPPLIPVEYVLPFEYVVRGQPVSTYSESSTYSTAVGGRTVGTR